MTEHYENQLRRHMDAAKASEYITATGVTIAKLTLDKLRCVGGGPKFHKFGGRVVYRVDDLDAWLAAKLGEPLDNTSQAKKSGEAA